jgi:hypothetical protein
MLATEAVIGRTPILFGELNDIKKLNPHKVEDIIR